MTEERRREIIKVVPRACRDGTRGVRNVRREALGDIKDLSRKK